MKTKKINFTINTRNYGERTVTGYSFKKGKFTYVAHRDPFYEDIWYISEFTSTKRMPLNNVHNSRESMISDFTTTYPDTAALDEMVTKALRRTK